MSGGIDSSVCAHHFKNKGHDVNGVFIDFGQAANVEEHRAVNSVCAHLEIPLAVLILRGNTTFAAGELVGRNAFLIFSTVFHMQLKDGILALGVHAGTRYYDCTPTFVKQVSRILSEQSDGRLQLVAPYLNLYKGEVFELFRTAAIPLELTYSCERGTAKPCGTCLSCQDRMALSNS
jgi:7-cyano-7-deazaguanine synthase